MGAGCTISATNKSFLNNMQVSSPQKKIKVINNPLDQSHLSNKIEQNTMLQPENQQISQNSIELQNYSPRFDDTQLKKLKIGRYLIESSPSQAFWKSYLSVCSSYDEIYIHLQDLYQKEPNLFASKIEIFGSPIGFRWESWYFIFGDPKPSVLIPKPSTFSYALYETLLSKDCKNEDDIKKDLFRTFPHHPYFTEIDKEAQKDNMINIISLMSDTMGNARLFRILKAIANLYPQVGYCQGMNFLLGFLLAASGGKEFQVFQMFVKLVESPKFKILGFYENGFPLLKLYCFIFYKLLERKNNKLSKHLKDIELPDSLWLTKWILTMLVYSFPFEISLRLWDFIIGSKSLFSLIKICLAIIKTLETNFLQKDCMEIADFLREMIENKEILIDKKNGININPEAIIKKARKIKLTDKMIRKFVTEHIESLEKIDEKQNEYLLFYKEFGAKPKVKKLKKIKSNKKKAH